METYRAAVVDATLPNNPHSYQLQMIGSNQKVLELGAAVGDITRALVAQHCDVTVVEYDQTNQEELESITPNVVIGDLNDPKLFDQLSGPYDVVLAGDVLEHLLDPERVLRDAVGVLAPGGRIVVSLPNVAHIDVRLALLEGRFPYSPTGLLDNTHIRFFTRQTIDKLVAAAGLMIIEMRKVRVPAFFTELQVKPADVSQEVVTQILTDPDAETYQFVFMAVRVTADSTIDSLAERHTALGEERDLWVERYRVLEGQLAVARATAAAAAAAAPPAKRSGRVTRKRRG